MSAKEVKFSVDARDRMLHGIDTLTHAVRVTLGPKGRNVLLDKSFGAPRMTKDRSEEHTSELQSQSNLVCRLLPETIKITTKSKYLPRSIAAACVTAPTITLASGS